MRWAPEEDARLLLELLEQGLSRHQIDEVLRRTESNIEAAGAAPFHIPEGTRADRRAAAQISQATPLRRLQEPVVYGHVSRIPVAPSQAFAAPLERRGSAPLRNVWTATATAACRCATAGTAAELGTGDTATSSGPPASRRGSTPSGRTPGSWTMARGRSPPRPLTRHASSLVEGPRGLEAPSASPFHRRAAIRQDPQQVHRGHTNRRREPAERCSPAPLQDRPRLHQRLRFGAIVGGYGDRGMAISAI